MSRLLTLLLTLALLAPPILGAWGASWARGAETETTEALGPPWFQDALVFYNGFDGKSINTLHSEAPGASTSPAPGGLFGQGLSTLTTPLVLHSLALSPHRPLTLSFWWALPADLPIDGGFSLFTLTGKGHISAFCRGKGDWCGLQRPAGVTQVYDFPGLQNVNDIYDFDLRSSLDLHAGVWHHTAIVFRRAATVQVYTDGRPATEITTSGRAWMLSDDLTTLQFGGGVILDEVAVLDRAIDGDLIADYYNGVSQLRRYDALGEAAGRVAH